MYKKFKSIEDLVENIFDLITYDDPVSVVLHKNMAVDVLNELMQYDDMVLEYCDIDTFSYDKEYLLTVYFGDNQWHVTIEQAYDFKKKKYIPAFGTVLFHEDVNSKSQIDIENDLVSDVTDMYWFEIDDNADFYDDECDYDDFDAFEDEYDCEDGFESDKYENDEEDVKSDIDDSDDISVSIFAKQSADNTIYKTKVLYESAIPTDALNNYFVDEIISNRFKEIKKTIEEIKEILG